MWCGWCSGQEISPTRSNVNYVLDFWGELFEKGLKNRTIGTYRSVISVFHDPIENIWVGNHPRISTLMSGIFNKRPPQSKYPFIWDVETVLDFLRKLPGNDLLSDKLLTLNVSVLLSLFSALRVLEITNMIVDYLKKHSSAYTFDEDLLEGQKTAPQSEVIHFPRWQQTLCMEGNYPILKNVMLGWLGKTNFLSATLNHINWCLRQQSLGGWDKFSQWRVSTQNFLRCTQIDQHHLQRLK